MIAHQSSARRAVLASLFFCLLAAALPSIAQVNITITGQESSNQFTVTGSGSQAPTPFTFSTGTITEPGPGDFLNNTTTFQIPAQAGSDLMAVTAGSGGAEEAITLFQFGSGPPQSMGIAGAGGTIGGFNAGAVTISASGTGVFIIPGASPQSTVGELFNPGTFSTTSNGVTYNYIINILPDPPVILGGGVGKTSLPDILIGRSFPRLRGDNIYNKKKASKKQTLKYTGVIARAHTAQVFLQLQNDGTQNDNIAFRAFVQRPQGTDSTVFSRVNGKKKNITAKVKTGKLRFSLAPGNRVRITYRLKTRPLWGGLYPGRDNEVRFLARSGKEKDNAAAYIQFR